MAEMSKIEEVAKVLHEKLSEQDLIGYLGANFDLHAVARAAIEAMGPMMDDARHLAAVLHDMDQYRSTFRREPNQTFREFWYTAIASALSEEVAG